MTDPSIYAIWDNLRDAASGNDFTSRPFLCVPEHVVRLLAENELLTFIDEHCTCLGHVLVANEDPNAPPYEFLETFD
jgi:hypothetical protein